MVWKKNVKIFVQSQRKKRGRKTVQESDEEDEFTFEEHDEEEQQSQKKRKKKKKTIEEEDDEEFIESTQKDDSISSEEKKSLISNLVRLFIIRDSKKQPVTKKDISSFVMAGKTKKRGIFKEIFSEASKNLKDIFGFDVIEVVKTETEDTDVAKTHSSNKKSKLASNTCWILRLSKFENEKSEEIEYRNEQLILDELKPKYGLLMIIICLIMINDAPLEEEILWRDLKKLDIFRKKEHEIFGNPEKLIEQFVKELYLIKITTAGTSETGTLITYKAGTRATTEIPDKFDVLKFISKITGTSVDRSTLTEFNMIQETQQDSNNPTISTNSTEAISLDEEWINFLFKFF